MTQMFEHLTSVFSAEGFLVDWLLTVANWLTGC